MRFLISLEGWPGRRWKMTALAASVALLVPAALLRAPRQQVARLGDFRLQNGDVITDAVIGYRTVGTLNGSRSNAVLVTPWFQGTTRQIARQIGRDKLVDSSKYFVIMVDAFGNGISSSPSSSARQPDDQFPVLTIADIVESHYVLVTRVLRLTHLHAVVGISMGGMQVFQWTVTHPGFVDKAVSIVGSPKSQPDDRQRWNDGIRWLGDPARTRAREMLSRGKPLAALNEFWVRPYDYIRQAHAIMTLDITRSFGGSMERTAAAIQAELMVVGTRGDVEVNPGPAFELGRLAGAEILELDDRCGHQAPSCERETLWRAVAHFLDR